MRLSHADRDKIWEGIARKITSVSQVPRSVKDIKHRWDDMKRRTKDKLAFMQKSLSGPGAGGRAPAIVLTAHERAIESALLTARSGHGFPRVELDGHPTALRPAMMKMRRRPGPRGSPSGGPCSRRQRKRPAWPGPPCSSLLPPLNSPRQWAPSPRPCPGPRLRPRPPTGPLGRTPAHPAQA
ncbi:myb-related transcription factor, partner of profilin-like [Phocoena sinus]|uniref:myb-related transcription factor, partner of profilin-like n=1 Tax=Phocoena sinus TaxID=42100 RepID=UPI0013C53AA1|nr:myb-related transcription factor, partner of profilin-like [Phocoena sinus]